MEQKRAAKTVDKRNQASKIYLEVGKNASGKETR